MGAESAKPVEVYNLNQANYQCVFPVCGGVCCKNGRPGLELAEENRIDEQIEKFLPHMRPAAQQFVAERHFMTDRKQQHRRVLSVVDGWCVFFNEGCVLHKVGAMEGDKYRYKPWQCIVFPLDREAPNRWYVRQWALNDEAWDIFCINPQESPVPAAESLKDELSFIQRLETGLEAWRGIPDTPETEPGK